MEQVRARRARRARPARRCGRGRSRPGSGRGRRSRFAHAELLERVERDPAVRRQLAAGDAEHPRRAASVDGLAARVRGRARRRRAARAARRTSRAPAPMPSTATAASARTCARRRRSTRGVVGLALVQRVGRPEQQHALPRDREADPHLVVRDRQRGAPVLAAVDDDVHALAQPDRRRRAPDPRAAARGRATARLRSRSRAPRTVTSWPSTARRRRRGRIADDLCVVEDGAPRSAAARTFSSVRRPSFVHASA